MKSNIYQKLAYRKKETHRQRDQRNSFNTVDIKKEQELKDCVKEKGLKDLESERASKNEKLTVIKIRKGNENAVS